MARLVDRDPSRCDELADLEGHLGVPTVGKTEISKQPAAISPVKKDLVPRSASKTSVRKVRRLDGGAQALDNPLFRPWNSTLDGGSEWPSDNSPSKSPTRHRQSLRMSSRESQHIEFPSELDSPLPTASLSRLRRAKASLQLEDDFEQDVHGKGSSLQLRIRQLRISKGMPSSTSATSEIEFTADETTNEDLESTELSRVIESDEEQPCVATPGPEAKCALIGADEPTFYETVGDESDGYKDESHSSFTTDEASGESLSYPPVKLLFSPQNADAASGDDAASNGCGSVLQPRHANLMAPKSSAESNDNMIKHAHFTQKDGPQRIKVSQKATAADLADTFSKLRLEFPDSSEEGDESPSIEGFAMPPSTPPKMFKSKSLMSPRKQARIPQTPHRPSIDAFWKQDLVDDWNEQHSPRKPVLPATTKSPSKTSPKKNSNKEAKRSFEAKKHALADDFLSELDSQITHGEIAKLAESTGGVKLVWTKKLQTTAGRANWKRETVRTKQADGTEVAVTHKHHASIELAEKVIDDEERLLNVLAHEFCHLANFMINGMTNNPHGKEFKAWAAKCSRTFGERGIEVTTKHSYDIDFKYVWECGACGSQYKRHSKSIDPQKHRCGGCKSILTQTRPVPRSGSGKSSDYQIFVKEQMKVVREENPGSPQKDVMRMVADKWAKRGCSASAAGASADDTVVGKMIDLTLGGTEDT